jgi:taurine dioxygenase
MGIRLRPLADTVGAEVTGVDLNEAVDDATFAAIRAAWLRHAVLLFRGQHALTPERHIEFSRRFGTLEIFTLRQFTHKDHPELFVISNLNDDEGKPIGAQVSPIWHSDSQFLEEPSMGSLLLAKEVPKVGADTLFASTVSVYDALPEATKRRIDGMRVSHSRIRAYPLTYPNRPPLTEEEKARTPDVIHPLVRTHPETGRKALYIGRSTAPEIVGLAKEESDALIDELMAFATAPRFVYRHEWRVGDLVFWDNRASIHCATPYDAARERRLMLRTTISGDRPY